MKLLNLVPLAGDVTQGTQTRLVTVGVGNVSGCAVAPRVLERQAFTSVHVWRERFDLREGMIGRLRLTRDNPYLNPQELSQLDADGLVQIGTRVNSGEILASVIELDLRERGQGRKAAKKGMQWVTDQSWRTPPGWDGAAVTFVGHQGKNDLGREALQGLRGRLEVELQMECPLVIGDVLVFEGRPIVVTEILRQPVIDREGREADIVVSPQIARGLGISSERHAPFEIGKGEVRGDDVVEARSAGVYSLITLEPLGKRRAWPQLISAAHIQWLLDRDCRALIGELASLKCDDTSNRDRCLTLLNESPESLLNLSAPAAPESLAAIVVHLRGLGLGVALEDKGGHVALRVWPASDEEVRQASGGVVVKPETLHYRTYDDMPNGIFCPQIFGRSNFIRRRKFGHISLAVPIVPFLWRQGEPSVLQQATGLPKEQIDQVLSHQADVVWTGNSLQLIARPNREEKSLGTGARALAAIIELHPPANLPAVLRKHAARLISSELAVIPPDWRPIVLLDSGNFATSDLNDHYRRAINRNNRLRKLIELKAPQVILDNESRMLQETVDTLHANALLPEAEIIRGHDGRPLVDFLRMLADHSTESEKRVDWSGAARLIADPNLPDDRVIVPARVFDTLRLSGMLPVLLSVDFHGQMAALYPTRGEKSVLRVSPSVFAVIAGEADLPIAQVYRPITERGHEEATRLVRGGGPSPFPAHSSIPHSLHRASADEMIQSLIAAALSGESISLDSAQGLLVGGTGSTQFSDDRPNPRHPEQVHQAPIAIEAEPIGGTPSSEEMLAFARKHALKACMFDVERVEEPPAADRGRLGGEPFLPEGMEWPFLSGKPLPFLGQFPLEPARQAGLLPIDVPPDSMLSIFGGEDCWEPQNCQPRCPVFIHSIEGLTPRSIPDELEDRVALCSVTPRIVEETPDWEELSILLSLEFDYPSRGHLQQFKNEHFKELASATKGIKIGGWPKWVQNADSTQPLLLQLATDDESGIMFGDSGTLYVFVENNQQLTCMTQCY